MEHARHLINEMLHNQRARYRPPVTKPVPVPRCTIYLVTQSILKLIAERGEISRQEIMTLTNITDGTLKAAIQALLRAEQIQYVRRGVNSVYSLSTDE